MLREVVCLLASSPALYVSLSSIPALIAFWEQQGVSSKFVWLCAIAFLFIIHYHFVFPKAKSFGDYFDSNSVYPQWYPINFGWMKEIALVRHISLNMIASAIHCLVFASSTFEELEAAWQYYYCYCAVLVILVEVIVVAMWFVRLIEFIANFGINTRKNK